MIVVIADDLSGAAELAGIAARHGITSEVHTLFNPKDGIELIAIDVDSRLLSTAAAADRMKQIARAVMAHQPDWIFKKTDSILRGNVRAEIEAILEITGQRKAILIPANPSRNRIIKGGHYFVGDSLLHETHFSLDPHHPRKSSLVAELLGPSKCKDAIISPDVSNVNDLQMAAAKLDADHLPAGGADFFEAILKLREPARKTADQIESRPAGRTLFICGSPTAWECGRAAQCRSAGVPVFLIPLNVSAVLQSLKIHDRAMIAIGDGVTDASATSNELLAQLLNAAADVLSIKPSPSIEQICIEGGATAAAFLGRFGCRQLKALGGEFAFAPLTGFPENLVLRIKPGSYPWPADIL
jgi:uncharacterized protein YgbK (DUF1537 family)